MTHEEKRKEINISDKTIKLLSEKVNTTENIVADILHEAIQLGVVLMVRGVPIPLSSYSWIEEGVEAWTQGFTGCPIKVTITKVNKYYQYVVAEDRREISEIIDFKYLYKTEKECPYR